MLIDPAELKHDTQKLEEIEKASLRLVVQAILDFRETAVEIFHKEKDLPQDMAEDVTREALDRMGVSRIDERLFGKIDYKRARYVFEPEYSVRQALFVDSKAEDVAGEHTATIQTAQTSMRIRQIRSGKVVDEQGKLPTVLETSKGKYLTTTIFVKYDYKRAKKATAEDHQLLGITAIALPNGMLQDIYNPSTEDSFWRAGRNAPKRNEEFRVRIGISALKYKRGWRVQKLPIPPAQFVWSE
jgi:hypothetical protein